MPRKEKKLRTISETKNVLYNGCIQCIYISLPYWALGNRFCYWRLVLDSLLSRIDLCTTPIKVRVNFVLDLLKAETAHCVVQKSERYFRIPHKLDEEKKPVSSLDIQMLSIVLSVLFV